MQTLLSSSWEGVWVHQGERRGQGSDHGSGQQGVGETRQGVEEEGVVEEEERETFGGMVFKHPTGPRVKRVSNRATLVQAAQEFMSDDEDEPQL